MEHIRKKLFFEIVTIIVDVIYINRKKKYYEKRIRYK